MIAEYALVRSRRARLEVMREEGAKGAALALEQLANVNEYISAVQIGVTMTSIGIGALGEPALASILKSALGNTLSHGVAVVIAVVVAFAMIASAQLIAGEMVPKFYAIDRAEAVARRVARPLQTFSTLFHPFIVALTAVADRILRLLGVDMSQERRGGSSDELKRLIAESHAGGQIDQGEAGMLTGVFHLHEQEARQVMTPIAGGGHGRHLPGRGDGAAAVRLQRPHAAACDRRAKTATACAGSCTCQSSSRQLMQDGPHTPIEPVVHEALIVPETKPLDDLLADLQRQRTSMAVVVDEYGRVVGVVTVEDIIEEVVGEIADETDPAAGEIRQLADGDWLVRGHVAVTDLADYGLHLPVDSDAYNSVGGFVFAQLGRLPKRGDTIAANGFSIRVESVRDNRIEAVRIRERRQVAQRERRSAEDCDRPVKHDRPAGGADRIVRTGRRRVCDATLMSHVQVSPP